MCYKFMLVYACFEKLSGECMKIIAGLGNPGNEYKDTKHNVGFMFIDALSDVWGVTNWKEKDNALLAETFVNNEKILLVKPLTFMNESGRAVEPLLNFYKLNASDLIVVHDDMDIPAGAIRIRKKGSGGGHKGVQSILDHIKDENFVRFRIGIGRPYEHFTVIKHVLSPFSEEDREKINLAIKSLIPAAKCVIERDADMAMNRFNPKKEKKKDE